MATALVMTHCDTLHGAELTPVQAPRETELRQERFAFTGTPVIDEQPAPGIVADVVIPPDLDRLERIYLRVDCQGALEFALKLTWQLDQVGKPALVSDKLDLGIQPCTPDLHSEIDLTPWITKSFRPTDMLQVSLSAMFVKFRAVVLEFHGAARVGPQGAPGIGIKGDKGDKGDQGIPGVGVKGDKGDTGAAGRPGVCPVCSHKPPCRSGDRSCGD